MKLLLWSAQKLVAASASVRYHSRAVDCKELFTLAAKIERDFTLKLDCGLSQAGKICKMVGQLLFPGVKKLRYAEQLSAQSALYSA